jgi:Raf kinase inhibitor-like YbhB/YbcL family protein
MYLSSPAYLDGDVMPVRFATINVLGGTGASVPLAWGGAPPGTRSFALAMIDTHPVAHGWVHWLVLGIPPDTRELPEGVSAGPGMPPDAEEFANTAGKRGYGGPQPPVGSGDHDYVTTLYALDVEDLTVPPDATWDEVRSAMSGHVLASATLVGRFGR